MNRLVVLLLALLLAGCDNSLHPAFAVTPTTTETVTPTSTEWQFLDVTQQPSVTPPLVVCVTAETALNLRRDASVTQEPLLQLPPGTRLDVLEVGDGWLRVKVQGRDLGGWVKAEFVGTCEQSGLLD